MTAAAPNPSPSASFKMTTRNWINVIVIAIAAGAVIAAQYGVHVLPGLDAAHTQTAAYAFAVGALFPGSPIGRILDWLASFFGGPPAPTPTLADVNAAKSEILPPPPRPTQVSSSRTAGYASFDVLLAVLALASLAWAALRAWAPAVLVAIGLAGCSPSALQVNATLASGAADIVNDSCKDGVEVARDAEQRHAVDAYATREEASAAVTAVRTRWEPYVFACDLISDAQNAWADVIVGLVASGGSFSLALVLPPMSRFARAWDDFVALHPPMPDGITLPTIDPAIVAALATLAPTEGAE